MISVFYQAESLRDIGHLEVEPSATIAQLKELVAKATGAEGEVVLFIEDEDEPLEADVVVKDVAGAHGLKVHAHRCKEIAVAVTFNRKVARRKFKPRHHRGEGQEVGGHQGVRHDAGRGGRTPPADREHP